MLRFDSARKFKIVEDDNGFIVAEGVIASAGEKLVYRDGIETVTESALFENMDEWSGLPLTLQHPRDLLTPETTQKHQVGSVVKAWRQDNELWARFKITVKSAVDAVKSGMRGLSAGYRVALDDAKNQIARSNNHLAICDVGRAQSSGIRADQRESFEIEEGKSMPSIKFANGKEFKLDCSDAEATLIQQQIDGVETRADSAEKSLLAVDTFLSEHFDMSEEDMTKKLDEMKTQIEQMKKDGEDFSKLQGQYDQLKEEQEKSKGKMDSGEMCAILDAHEKVVRVDSAIKLRKEDGSIKSADDLYREALISINKDIKLDGKNAVYVEARLDAALENLDADNVRKQRGEDFRKDSSDGLTVQERANQSFYQQQPKKEG